MNIKKDVDLKDMNTLGVSSMAKEVVYIDSIEDILQAISGDFIILGDGSNVLLPDYVDKRILKINIKGIEETSNSVLVGAGESWDGFVERAINMSIPFIENFSGIPGTVGASPVQNIGAYGVEVGDLIEWLEVYNTETNRIEKLTDCDFGYRDSIFKKTKKYIITRVSFIKETSAGINISYKDLAEYFKDRTPTKKEIREAVIEIRSGKFPTLERYGTAGSFFKNPIISNDRHQYLKSIYPEMPSYELGECKKVPLAWILDKICHLKGYRDKNIWLHEKQPLVLVTNKDATSEEVKIFSEKIKQIVFEKTRIEIENEVTFV